MNTAHRLEPHTTEELRRLPYSYPEVGATRQPRLPTGYRTDDFSVVAGQGVERFEDVAELLFGWQIHLGAGLRIASDAERISRGTVVIATLPIGPVGLRTRCRVVYLIEEERRRGFAYGTLPGHPERGEEQFLVELDDTDTVRFRLRAFSRNASLLARLGGPVSRRVQLSVNRRYLRVVGEPGAAIEHRTRR